MSTLRISVLGSPSVEVDGVPVQVDTRKAIALLVYLAETRRTQSRERLAGLLWPDYDQDHARSALRRTLSALKKALDDRWVSADRLGVTLDHNDVEMDLALFRDALQASASHGHPTEDACGKCTRSLTTAVALVGGTFLHGFSLRDAGPFEEWQSLVAQSVEREFGAALAKLVRAHTASGDLETAVEVAQRKVALDPLDEPARRQLMQLYAWRGMRAAALQQYRDCVAVLDRELGVPPLPETRALYEAIVEGVVEPRELSTLQEPRSPSPPQEHGPMSLRGRSKEWDDLFDLYSNLNRRGAFAGIEGEAGIGKTRLARDFLEAAEERGSTTVIARSYEGEGGLPYALVTQLLEPLIERPGDVDPMALAEASRLVPALQPVGLVPGPIEDPGATTRFFEGVRQVLSGRLCGDAPGVVFLDDLHWCDRASLDVLGYILRRLDDTPICFVAAWRSEEVDQDHPVRSLAPKGANSHAMVLGRLTDDDVRGIVADFTDRPEDDVQELSARLMRETEGIPFFVVEYLAVRAAEEGEWQVPSSIKDLLRSRAGSVGPTARQILGAAAVIDRSFDFETVWRASGRTEMEVVDALDELVRHQLVVAAPGAATYEFSHEKLRASVYEAMSPARRRMLHRRAAEAFIASSPREEHLSALSALIARHLELGGMEPEAASYHEMAATRARSIFANREALHHYLAALALDHPASAVLHEGAGDMYVLLGEYSKAIDSYQAAAALAAEEAIPQIEHKLGEVHLRRGDWDLSQSHLVVALEALGPGETEVTRAEILAAMSSNAHRKGELDEAAALALRAFDAALASSDPRALSQAQNQLGILENARGHYDEAIAYLEESLRSAVERNDAPGRVASLNNLAHSARATGDLDLALKLTKEALDICARQGDRHREAALHNNMADLLHERGDTEAAMEHLKVSAAVLAEIGAEPTGMLPEVWKLVEW